MDAILLSCIKQEIIRAPRSAIFDVYYRIRYLIVCAGTDDNIDGSKIASVAHLMLRALHINLLLVTASYLAAVGLQLSLFGGMHRELYPAYIGLNFAWVLLLFLWVDWVEKKKGAVVALVVSGGVASWYACRAIYLWKARSDLFVLALLLAGSGGILVFLAAKAYGHGNATEQGR